MKSSVTFKILLIYIIIFSLTTIITSVAYTTFFNSALQNDAKSQLTTESKIIEDFLTQSMNHEMIEDNFTETAEFKILLNDRINRYLKYLNTSYIIVNKFKRPVYVNNSTADTKSNELVDSFILPKFKNIINSSSYNKIQTTDTIKYQGEIYTFIITPITEKISSDLKDGWIIVCAPSGPLSQIVFLLLKSFLISIPLSILLIAISGYFISKSFTQPIIEIKEITEQIAQRDFDKRISVTSSNEIGQLALAINSLASSLKQYDMAQKNFLQNASHELKTPLMSIQGYVEGLRDGVFPDPQKATDVIVEETNRLKNIVDSLVIITKLETTNETYSYSAHNLNAVIISAVDKLNGLAYSTHKEFKLKLGAETLVLMDMDKLTQAIINVLSNALRHSNNKIEISTKLISKDQVEIKIKDDGEGFKNNEEDKIFLRFYKGEKGSTGLGLTITKAIIKAHNGSIFAKNVKPHGALITIQLPTHSE